MGFARDCSAIHSLWYYLPAVSRYLTAVAVVSRNVAGGLRNIPRYGRNRESSKDTLRSKVCAIFIIGEKAEKFMAVYTFRENYH